jgi:hypothetical protein
MTHDEYTQAANLSRAIGAGELLHGHWQPSQRFDETTQKLLYAARDAVSKLSDHLTDAVKARID